jgi:hypothetical protein
VALIFVGRLNYPLFFHFQGILDKGNNGWDFRLLIEPGAKAAWEAYEAVNI